MPIVRIHVQSADTLRCRDNPKKRGEEVDSGRLQPKGLFDINEKY